MIKIVTDSTSDVPTDLANELGITVVPAVLQIDGATYVDGVTLSRSEFYHGLQSYRDVPTTAAPPVDVFINAFQSAAQQGADSIVAIHLNRRFSALCDVADVAAREVSSRGIQVHVVDSKSLTMGLGQQAITAARMARDGADTHQIIQHVEAMRDRAIIYALVDNLKYLRRSGRASGLMAGIGEMLHIKILLKVQGSNITQIDRIRTHAKGITRLLEIAHQHRNVTDLSVLHTSNDMQAVVHNIQNGLNDIVPANQQFIIQVTPVIGAHVGPFTVGVCMFTDV